MIDLFKPTFARSFNGTSNGLLISSPAIAAYPLSFGCWFYATANTANQTLISMSLTGSTARYFQLTAAGANAGDPVTYFLNNGAGGPSVSSTTGFTLNRWHYAFCSSFSSTAHTVQIDGGSTATTSTDVGGTWGFTKTSVGYFSGNDSNWHAGQIAWPAIWNITISAADSVRLAQGADPRTVRPENLVAFWDFAGTETEFSQGIVPAAFPLANTGSLPLNGPGFLRTRIKRRAMPNKPAGGGGGGNRRRRFLITGA